MTFREKEILDLLKENPSISQQHLADKLDITRSSVAVHITNLMKKGHILGKGYILAKENYVTVIGCSNIDLLGRSNDKILMNDSNPGKVEISAGGVGRNIAENLARLNVEVKLLSAVGNDLYGKQLLSHCKDTNIDVDDVYISDEIPSSTYLSILNENNEMQLAISHMDISDKIDIKYITQRHNFIKESMAIVVDTNINEEVINYITSTYNNIPIFVDAVSSYKCLKLKNKLSNIHTLKLNKLEAESLTNIKIHNYDDLVLCSHHLLTQGVRNVFITLGPDGVFCFNKDEQILIDGMKNVNVVNATGAGDAFAAALVYSYINKFNLENSARFAMAASVIALSHKDTINPNISIKNIEKLLKETY